MASTSPENTRIFSPASSRSLYTGSMEVSTSRLRRWHWYGEVVRGGREVQQQVGSQGQRGALPAIPRHRSPGRHAAVQASMQTGASAACRTAPALPHQTALYLPAVLDLGGAVPPGARHRATRVGVQGGLDVGPIQICLCLTVDAGVVLCTCNGGARNRGLCRGGVIRGAMGGGCPPSPAQPRRTSARWLAGWLAGFAGCAAPHAHGRAAC